MITFKVKRLAAITIIYWFLLLYIIAALVWWYISLQHQNNVMTGLLLNELRHDEPGYLEKVAAIQDLKHRKTAQYIGEGSIFLALIAFGAFYVYRIIRKRLRLSQQQQNFMMAVTHELKTPIAVVRLNLETIQKRKLDEQRQHKYIQVCLQEVNRLNSLCNNILLASQLDAGEYKGLKNEVNVSDLVKKAFAEVSARNPTRELRGTFEDDIVILGEATLLELLFSNLVENALKYSPPGTAVQVELFKDQEKVILAVKDQGPGIALEERSRIFEKFYRIGNEATRMAKGTGLGLYLSKEIAKDHHASIHIHDNEGGGSVFTVTFKQ